MGEASPAARTPVTRPRPIWRAAAIVGLLAVAGCGCSVRKAAMKMVADTLAEGSSSFSSDDDPELVKQAIPFGLKTMEGLVVQLPTHRPLLRSVTSGFTSYAAVFIAPEIRPLEAIDLERGEAERVRARRMFLRARDYGLRALEVPYPGFGNALRADPKRAVAPCVRADVPDLYWLAAAWGMAISNGKDQVDLIADAPIVEALIRRALELDEAYDDGAIHEFLVAFESRGESMGGSLVRARTHFDRARELARGRKISPLVTMAENVSVATQNRKEFLSLLDQALAFDIDKYPEIRLPNILSQRKARQLKAIVDELFLEETE